MDVATYDAHREALRAFDASYERVFLTIGRHTGLSYMEVARMDKGYCGWARELSSPYGNIASFHRFAVRRHALEQPINQLQEEERRTVERQRAEQLQRTNDERRALLALRKKTSRGQLVELTNDLDMFHSCIVKRLPLLTLLALAKVCKGTRDATNGHPDWNHVVASAMAERRASFEKHYNRSDRVRRHDKAVKCFFGLPSALDAVLEYDAAGLLSGFDTHMRVMTLGKASGPTSYSMVRNEVRLAINDRKKKLKVHEKAVDEMSDALMGTATKLAAADTRVKTAVVAMIAFMGEHNLKMQGVALANACAMPAHTELHAWENFATNGAFACPTTTTAVAPLAKR
jgi:hypothetical protein